MGGPGSGRRKEGGSSITGKKSMSSVKNKLKGRGYFSAYERKDRRSVRRGRN